MGDESNHGECPNAEPGGAFLDGGFRAQGSEVSRDVRFEYAHRNDLVILHVVVVAGDAELFEDRKDAPAGRDLQVSRHGKQILADPELPLDVLDREQEPLLA